VITVRQGFEALAFALGLLYALLAVRRNRSCFVAGGLSSAILAVLSAQARLPMQTGLQTYYIAMSIYGFRHWGEKNGARPVTTLPLRAHLVVIAVIFALGFVSAEILATETRSAAPFLDATTTWASLFATWLVTQVKLENWLYWIVIDAALAVLFAAQALYIVALLYVVYLAVAAVGYVAWLRRYRLAAAPV
jgi:nicotinamide mononucleotide transporter